MCIMCMAHMLTMDHGGQHQPAASAVATTGRTCSRCGFPLQAGFAFCPNCGMDLRAVSCPACGQAVDPTWKACPHCGAALGTGVAAASEHAHH